MCQPVLVLPHLTQLHLLPFRLLQFCLLQFRLLPFCLFIILASTGSSMFYPTQVHFSAPSCEMYDVTVNAFIWRIVMHLHPLMSLLKARVLIGLFIACLYSSFLYTATYSVLSTLSTYKYVTFLVLVQVKTRATKCYTRS